VKIELCSVNCVVDIPVRDFNRRLLHYEDDEMYGDTLDIKLEKLGLLDVAYESDPVNPKVTFVILSGSIVDDKDLESKILTTIAEHLALS
jgi:hypothetical protein